MPTKTLVASAYAAHLARRAGGLRRRSAGPSASTWHGSRRARTRSSAQPRRPRGWLRRHGTCTVVQGHARFDVAERSRASATESLARRAIFINVGGARRGAAIAGLDRCRISPTARSWSSILCREHLVVIGGSYVGLEFAQMYRRFGSAGHRRRDGPAPDRARGRRRLRRDPGDPRGRRHRRPRWTPNASRFEPHAEASRSASIAPTAAPADRRLASCCSRSGRRPNTDDLGLDKAGVAVDPRGYITVDDAVADQRRRASGRWATATAAAPSPTPPTTITRSSPPTCWTASRAASATASPPMRSTSIRRWAAPA